MLVCLDAVDTGTHSWCDGPCLVPRSQQGGRPVSKASAGNVRTRGLENCAGCSPGGAVMGIGLAEMSRRAAVGHKSRALARKQYV